MAEQNARDLAATRSTEQPLHNVLMPEKIPTATLADRLFAALQYLLPKKALSRVAHSIMRAESSATKRLLISTFLRIYRVNMSEVVKSDPLAYRSFNDFFTRPLRPDVRPIAPDTGAIISPVDGTVTEAGPVHGNAIIQAKGIQYSLDELLAGNGASVEAYRNGNFICIYLAPYDYHRIHMPFEGRLRGTVYVPGDLFSVNAASSRAVPRLFARNERVICDFDTKIGRMTLVLVGALFVGSIETVYAGEINPPPRHRMRPLSIAAGVGQSFAKGVELGRFNAGSTVVLLFQKDRVRWDASLEPLATVQMGRAIGQCLEDPCGA
jgi:phosphatidylserine decarboxylase